METVDPFAAVEAAISSYYECSDRPETCANLVFAVVMPSCGVRQVADRVYCGFVVLPRWCKNNADICTWDAGAQECWRGAAPPMTTPTPTTTTSLPDYTPVDNTGMYIGIGVAAVVVVVIAVVLAVVLSRTCAAQAKRRSLTRTLTESRVNSVPCRANRS